MLSRKKFDKKSGPSIVKVKKSSFGEAGHSIFLSSAAGCWVSAKNSAAADFVRARFASTATSVAKKQGLSSP